MTRDEDTFARVGGDEFVLLIDHMPIDHARKEAERLALAVSSANASLQTQIVVTASIGVLSIVDPHGLNPDQALRLSDDLMYEVKHATKNDIAIRVYAGEMTLRGRLARGASCQRLKQGNTRSRRRDSEAASLPGAPGSPSPRCTSCLRQLRAW